MTFVNTTMFLAFNACNIWMLAGIVRNRGVSERVALKMKIGEYPNDFCYPSL